MLTYFRVFALLNGALLLVAYVILFRTHANLLGRRRVIMMSRIRVEDLYFLPVLSLPFAALTVLFFLGSHAGISFLIFPLVGLSVLLYALLALYDRKLCKRANHDGIEYYGIKLPGVACVAVITAGSLILLVIAIWELI